MIAYGKEVQAESRATARREQRRPRRLEGDRLWHPEARGLRLREVTRAGGAPGIFVGTDVFPDELYLL